MKNLLLIPALMMLLVASSCEKEKDCSTGEVRVSNTTGDSYYIYVNGSLKHTLGGGQFINWDDMAVGSYSIKVVQKDGYILWPSEYTAVVYVYGCDMQEFIFP